MGDLHAVFREAVARVPLAAGWTVDTAADWAWARSQSSNWRHLVGLRGWPADEYVRRSVASIVAEIVRRP